MVSQLFLGLRLDCAKSISIRLKFTAKQTFMAWPLTSRGRYQGDWAFAPYFRQRGNHIC